MVSKFFGVATYRVCLRDACFDKDGVHTRTLSRHGVGRTDHLPRIHIEGWRANDVSERSVEA
jgi:hypothetical protein